MLMKPWLPLAPLTTRSRRACTAELVDDLLDELEAKATKLRELPKGSVKWVALEKDLFSISQFARDMLEIAFSEDKTHLDEVFGSGRISRFKIILASLSEANLAELGRSWEFSLVSLKNIVGSMESILNDLEGSPRTKRLWHRLPESEGESMPPARLREYEQNWYPDLNHKRELAENEFIKMFGHDEESMPEARLQKYEQNWYPVTTGGRLPGNFTEEDAHTRTVIEDSQKDDNIAEEAQKDKLSDDERILLLLQRSLAEDEGDNIAEEAQKGKLSDERILLLLQRSLAEDEGSQLPVQEELRKEMPVYSKIVGEEIDNGIGEVVGSRQWLLKRMVSMGEEVQDPSKEPEGGPATDSVDKAVSSAEEPEEEPTTESPQPTSSLHSHRRAPLWRPSTPFTSLCQIGASGAPLPAFFVIALEPTEEPTTESKTPTDEEISVCAYFLHQEDKSRSPEQNWFLATRQLRAMCN